MLYRQKVKGKTLKTWWCDFTIDGNRVRASTKKKDKYEASLVEHELMEKARQNGTASVNHKSPLLRDFAPEFTKWLDDTHSIADQTKRFYRHGWEMLKATPIAEMKLSAIKQTDVDVVSFPGGNFTANQALRTLSRMLSFAKASNRFFGETPKIKMRKVWGRSVKMSNADAALIASKMKDGSDAKDVLLILRSTGMRPKECFAMRWQFCTWDRAEYQNPEGKTKTAQRAVPLLGDSLAILKRRWLAQGMPREGWVFPSNSKSGHILNIAKAFRIARKAAGLPPSLVVYCARHGALTDLATVLPLAATMAIGGHSDARTALGYQHHEVNDLQARLNEARTNGRIN